MLSLAAATTACRQDMQDQPRYKPLHESDFFADRRSARPQVEGTVAREHLRIDAARYIGKVGDNDVTAFPFPITHNDILRGQERFNIYCTPCHGRLGDGQGLVVKRGYVSPPSYHIPRLRDAPVGHFFDVMTNGYGAMPSYASRVTPDDRWRITAYIRALQYAEGASVNDVPADERQKLDASPQTTPPERQSGEAPANPAREMPAPVRSTSSPMNQTNQGTQPSTQPSVLPGPAGPGARSVERGGRP